MKNTQDWLFEREFLSNRNESMINSLHPLVSLIYFVAMSIITMLTLNPLFLCVSFIASIVCLFFIQGVRRVLISLMYSIIVFLLMAAFNPIFVHKGETLLFFINGRAVTLEAIYYGMCAAFMLITVYYWLRCFSAVMSSDKITYLIGRVFPRLALLLSISIGFIPEFKKLYKNINGAQKAMGIYASNSLINRLRCRFNSLSTLIGLSLESAIDKADSMTARGYGLKWRTTFSRFSWTFRDSILFAYILLTSFLSLFFVSRAGVVSFYPTTDGFYIGKSHIVAVFCIFLLAISTIVLEVKDRLVYQLRDKKSSRFQKNNLYNTCFFWGGAR